MASGDKYTIEEDTLVNIGDAIREMTGSQEGITPENMPTAVRSIETGDSVSWDQTQLTGTKIAEIAINGTTTDVYAPSPTPVPTVEQLTDIEILDLEDGDLIIQDSGEWRNQSATELIGLNVLCGLFGYGFYNKTHTYSRGAIVLLIDPEDELREIQICKCIANNVTGNWDWSKWSQIYIAEIIWPLANFAEITFTMNVGESSTTYADSRIHTDSTVQIFTNKYGVYPDSVVIREGYIDIDFDTPLTSNLQVKVRIT